MKQYVGILLFFHPFLHALPEKAVTIVPVADLIGKPTCLSTARKTIQYYQQLPLCGNNNSSELRIHQLLFNEVVTIHEERGAEVCVSVPNVFYKTESGELCTRYWSLKKNFVTFKSARAKKIPITIFPEPIHFESASTQSATQRIVTLKQPFFCKTVNFTFSAGTRFVACAEQQEDNYTHVHCLNASTMEKTTIAIPKNLCISIPPDKKSRQKLFVSLLKQWACEPSGFIPYVWGGCSFMQTCCSSQFLEKKRSRLVHYERPELIKPYTGFDCSGLIWRCAQICGIPLYCKNSYTFAQELKSCNATDRLTEGDLLWFPGHIMIISDIRKNLVIEARAYGHGYGKVHELPIGSVFKNINSVDELMTHYSQEKELPRLNKDGQVVQKIPMFKLLKLASAWQ